MLISWHYASFLHHYYFQWIESWCYEWWRSHIAQSPPHKAWSQILNSPVLLKVKWVGDSGLMNDRIALISHWFEFVCTRLTFAFIHLNSSVVYLWFVFTGLHSFLIGLHLSSLVQTRVSFVYTDLVLVCNISNNLVFRLNLRSADRQKIMNWP